jgi:hypothetical protein
MAMADAAKFHPGDPEGKLLDQIAFGAWSA